MSTHPAATKQTLSPATGAHDLRGRVAVVALLVLYLIVLLRTAWISDDAHITLRVVDNMIQGYGPNWNVAERVQVYTHPLWFLLLSLSVFVTREFYLTTILLSLGLALASVGVMLMRLSRSWWGALLGGLILLLSPAFVDYSTSGLENPLSFLLLSLFALVAMRQRAGAQRTFRLTLLAALICVNRLDLILMVTPTVALDAFTNRHLRQNVLGLLPLFLWFAFALTYYGWILPNTAAAKLSGGIERSWYLSQGFWYLRDALRNETLMSLAIAAALMVAMRRHRERSALTVGIVLYLAYTVWIGGDFMRGRMLTAPLLVSIAILLDWDFVLPRFVRPIIAATVLALGFLAPTPTLLSGSDFGSTTDPRDNRYDAANERAVYFPQSGLLNSKPLRTKTGHDLQALRERQEKEVVDIKFIFTAGVGGFVSGPRPYIIDRWALTNPLIARIPSPRGARPRIGHLERVVPAGYYLSLLQDNNVLVDERLRRYYEHVRRLTRGPLFTAARWRSILGMLSGRYTHLLPSLVTPVDDQEYAAFVALDLHAGGPQILRRAARVHLLAGDLQAAESILRRLGDLEIAYADDYVTEAIGIAFSQRQRDATFSEDLLRLVVELEPESGTAAYGLSAFLMQAGHNEEAMHYLRRATELGSEQARKTLETLTSP